VSRALRTVWVVAGIGVLIAVLGSTVPVRGRASADMYGEPTGRVNCGSLVDRSALSEADGCEEAILGRVLLTLLGFVLATVFGLAGVAGVVGWWASSPRSLPGGRGRDEAWDRY